MVKAKRVVYVCVSSSWLLLNVTESCLGCCLMGVALRAHGLELKVGWLESDKRWRKKKKKRKEN